MIIFLYGSDGYRLKENIDTIVGTYQKKHKNGLSFYSFDFGNNDSFSDLANSIKNISFFDEVKLIVVKNLFSARKGVLDKLIELLNEFEIPSDKKTVLVFVENKGQKELEKSDKNLFALLNLKPNLIRNVEYLSGVKLRSWIKGEFKKHGHDVPIGAVDLLVNFVGNESWALANEIEKLVNYKKRGNITEKDIDTLVAKKEDPSIFALTDAVGNKNKAKAFEMIYRLINSGSDPHYLLSMLVYHFENLLSVCDGNIPKHLHPFVAKKAFVQAEKFDKEDLLSKFNLLADFDIASKDGRINLGDALYNFVIS